MTPGPTGPSSVGPVALPGSAQGNGQQPWKAPAAAWSRGPLRGRQRLPHVVESQGVKSKVWDAWKKMKRRSNTLSWSICCHFSSFIQQRLVTFTSVAFESKWPGKLAPRSNGSLPSRLSRSELHWGPEDDSRFGGSSVCQLRAPNWVGTEQWPSTEMLVIIYGCVRKQGTQNYGLEHHFISFPDCMALKL